MTHFSNEVMEKILQIVYRLPTDYSNFPRNTIKLISEFFGYKAIQFCPFNAELMPNAGSKRHGSSENKFVSLNIPARYMKLYNENYADKDIFNLRNLPPQLRKRKALLIEDVMPMSEFEKTPYCEFINSLGFAYEMRVLLKHNHRSIAGIGLYRTEQEGGFTAEDVRLFEFLSDYISQSMEISLRQSLGAVLFNNFDLIFADMKAGAVLLNDSMMVVRANDYARQCGEELSHVMAYQHDFFVNDLYYLDEKNVQLQRLIIEIGPKLIRTGEAEKGGGATKRYRFSYTHSSAETISGGIENYYLVIINGDEDAESSRIQEITNSLTNREKDVLNCLVNGMNNDAIAQDLFVSIHTVRTHVANIYKKFGVNSRIALLLKLKTINKQSVKTK